MMFGSLVDQGIAHPWLLYGLKMLQYVADIDDVVDCGWVNLLVGGVTQAPQSICFLTQYHHGAARCYFALAAIVVPRQ
jgi:hypothetical protein